VRKSRIGESRLSDWSNPFASGIKDKGQLQFGRESAERGKAWARRRSASALISVAVGKLYSDFESTPQRARLLDYRDAMGDVAAKYPEDHEANIFYALALAASEDPADKTYAGRLKAGAILEKLFRGGADASWAGTLHYPCVRRAGAGGTGGWLRHGVTRKLRQMRRMRCTCQSHTFTRMGYWQESIDSNIAAAAAARREGQTAEELHASDYEIYAYLQTGQDEAAGRIENSLSEIESRFDPKALLRRRWRSLGWIFCSRGDSGTLRAGAPGLEAGGATRASGDAVSLYRCHDVVHPRI